MTIESVSNSLPIHFDHDRIKTLLYDKEGNVSVIGKDNKVLSRFPTKASVAYNRQYGTPISSDGQYVFIGTWEYGIFCYSLETGHLNWKQRPGKVRNIVVSDNILFIEMADRGIYVRDVESGQVLQEIKMTAIDKLKLLTPLELFAGPKNGKYFIFNVPTSEIKREIKIKSLNVNNCLSFIILDAFYKNNNLFVKGWEQYSEGNYQDENQIWFEREVPFA